MHWAGWLAWVLVILLIAAIVIYLIVQSRKPRSFKELKVNLDEMVRKRKVAEAALVKEKVERQKVEKEKAKHELALLEHNHKEKLEALNETERRVYEKVKTDPKYGIDYINDLLGDGDDGTG